VSKKLQRLATTCAHAGSNVSRSAVSNEPFQFPIVQSTVFNLGSSDEAEAIFSGARKGYAYSRFGNPSVELLAETLAQMEGGAGALITSSGNAAILCAVTASLEGRNGPLVTHQGIYGGSLELLGILSTIHRSPVQFVDPSNQDHWFDAVSRSGAVLVETPSNPLLRLIDIEATVRQAHACGASVMVDNTVATPFNQRPLESGADWVVHSTSKYLNGHSDMIGGCLIRKDPLSPMDRSIHKNLGGTVNALDAWLVLRGLRTFALRMEAHNRNGAAVAAWLTDHPKIRQVHYPGLASHPQIELFQRQMKHGGALLSFELAGGKDAACQFLDRMRLILHAVSLGGMESLATRPAMSSHRGMTAEARLRDGVSDGLIRLSVGVEALEDILADLDQALAG
jgi:cystathionine beta-lyase/cystathionine gamma-synthase